jgi:hypothetical protein
LSCCDPEKESEKERRVELTRNQPRAKIEKRENKGERKEKK